MSSFGYQMPPGSNVCGGRETIHFECRNADCPKVGAVFPAELIKDPAGDHIEPQDGGHCPYCHVEGERTE